MVIEQYLDWVETIGMIDQLYNVTKALFEPKVILAIPRGGLIPGVILSHRFNVPLVITNSHKRVPKKIERLGNRILIVDEIADTGDTLLRVKRQCLEKGYATGSDIKIAVLCVKPWSVVEPDFVVMKTDHWVIFPWETKK